MVAYHQSVMLRESLEGLAIQPDGTYVDLTFGGGGHSRAILAQLPKGRLIAFDQDQDTASLAAQIQHPGFTFIQANFRFMRQFLEFHGITAVDGILADLGVSSFQLDTPERGFAARLPQGKLDMRMNQATPQTAQDVLNTASEALLTRIFRQYGEVQRARALAEATVAARRQKPFEVVADFKAVVDRFAPRNREYQYYAKVFQALRIHINDELGALQAMLVQSAQLLRAGGRLVVLAYHSLEDRLVKAFMRTGNFAGIPQQDSYGNTLRPLEPLHSKPQRPSLTDIQHNNRCRSARLRVAVRTGQPVV